MYNYFPYNRKPHYYETDMMGVIHHSNYIRWFEEARLDFLEQSGFAYSQMEEEGVIIPVLSVEVKYLNFITYDDEVSIFVRIKEYTGVKLELSYEVFRNSDNVLCTTGTSSHTFVDANKNLLRLKRTHKNVDSFFKNLNESKDEKA